MLYQRMRNEPEAQPHTIWARQDPPPKGTWIAYAKSLQDRHQIPNLEVQAKRQPPLGQRARRSIIRKYAKQTVSPAISAKERASHRDHQLPWAWIQTCIENRAEVRTFEEWWAWRIMAKPPRQAHTACRMCLASTPCDTQHVKEGCQPAAAIATGKGQDIRNIFEVPDTPDHFIVVLEVISATLSLWDANDT